MRIAYIGQKGIPAKIGGVERYVDEVAVRMAKRGHEVFAYVRSHYTPKHMKSYEGVRLVHIPTIKTKHLDAIVHTFLSTLHALFMNFDIIHYHSLGPTSLSFLPKLFCRRTAIVSTYQTQDYYHAKWGFFARTYLKFGEFMTLHVPDKVISVSEILRNYGLKVYGKDSDVIPNGVTMFSSAAPLEIFAKWGLDKKRFLLVVSRLVPHKEIHTLIGAFLDLKKGNDIPHDFKLVIAGEGSYTDKYVQEIKAMARGRKDVVLAGIQRGEKLAALYHNAFLFVQPSRAEGLSLALLEAMGAGLAPLVSDIPENLSAIQRNGFIFRTGDREDLARKLKELISDESKVATMAEGAKTLVKEYYNWDKIVAEIEVIYKSAREAKEVMDEPKNVKIFNKVRVEPEK